MRIISLFLTVLFFSFSTMAQTTDEFDYKKINKQLTAIENNLNSGNVSAPTISEHLKTVNIIQTEINQMRNAYNDKLENTNKKISALGDNPQDGATEATEITSQRKNFTAEAEKYKAKITQIELLNTQIEEINSLILKIRTQSLMDKILTRQTSFFQLKEVGKSLLSFMSFIYNIIKSPYDWYLALSSEQQQNVKDNAGYVFLGFIIITALAIYLSLYVRRRFGYKECSADPTYAQKLSSAVAMAFSYGVIPAVALGTFIFWLLETETVNTGNWGRFLYLSALYLLYFFLIRAAVRVIFVPKCGSWRIINVDDKKAKSVSRAIIYSAAVILPTELLLKFALDLESAPEIIYSLQILTIAAKAFGIIIVTRRLLHNPIDDIEITETEENYFLSSSAKISLMITIFFSIAFVLSLLGYVRLSEYVINRFILSAVAVGILWLIDKLLRIVIRRVLRLKFWVKNLHINPRLLVKTEFWLGLALKPLLWTIGIISILGIWGFSIDIMLHDIKNFLLGFNVGGMRISIISLIIGVASFFISMFIFKTLKRSLLTGNLSKIDMEESSRSSLAAGISLIGFIISLIVAFNVMGGSLSSIALIAGALSFGVGLGLQNIVSNFVSGIIIIFERPIKIGDWVIISGQEGIVKAINMRATLLEAFNKADIIIPNSTILSGLLVNMTYDNRTGRIELKVNVTYNNDVKKVQETLMEIASNISGVLKNPAPTVALADFSGGDIIYQLNCFTSNIYAKQTIINQIREQILTIFPQKGLQLPNMTQIMPTSSPEEQALEN